MLSSTNYFYCSTSSLQMHRKTNKSVILYAIVSKIKPHKTVFSSSKNNNHKEHFYRLQRREITV